MAANMPPVHAVDAPARWDCTGKRKGHYYYSVKNSTNPPGGFVRMVSMNKTYTPELAPKSSAGCATTPTGSGSVHCPTQFSSGGVYLQGLLLDGDRKSIEPSPQALPARRTQGHPKMPNSASSNSSARAPGTSRRSRSASAPSWPRRSPSRGIFVIDDSGFPKQGKHSVGVQRAILRPQGKKANCVRQESLGKGKRLNAETFRGTLRVTNPPGRAGQQPEASLAWCRGDPRCEA